MEKLYKVQMNSKGAPDFSTALEIPSSDNHDWEKYSDRLWKLAYERGKASVRPQGENLLEKYPSLFECSVCGASCSDTIPWDCNINYCPNCGAQMKGVNDETRNETV